MMSTRKPNGVRDVVLNGLHVALAAILLFMSFLVHGRVPGLSADASTALGFLFFFYLGLPLLLIAIGTIVWSVLVKGQWVVELGASLFVAAILVLLNVWLGLLASLGYLCFALWTLFRRIRGRAVDTRPGGTP